MPSTCLPITDFDINVDIPGSLLPDNTFTNAINFVVRNGSYCMTKETEAAPVSSAHRWPNIPTSDAYNLAFIQRGVQYFFLANSSTKDYIFDGSNWIDITSTDKAGLDLFATKNSWTVCKLGFNAVINTPLFFPEYWSGQVGINAKPLPFSPTKSWKQKNFKCKVMRSHLNFLFALNLTENGIDYPYSYRWSHPADENGIPFSWDESDLSTIASKESVGGDYGIILDGLSLRNSFCIYTERAVHILDYTGDEYVFRRRLLSSSYGLLATNCVVEAEGKHYFISAKDIVVNDGNTIRSILTNKLKALMENISVQNYRNSYAVVNPIKTEIWFCFPEGNYKFPSMAIVYNYATNKFGVTRLASKRNGVGTASCMVFGSFLPPGYPWNDGGVTYAPPPHDTWDTFQVDIDYAQTFTPQGIINEIYPEPVLFTDIWDISSYSALSTDLFTIGPTYTNIEQMEGFRPSNAEARGIQFKLICEKTNWALEGQVAVKTLLRIYPQIVAVGAYGQASIQVGAHDYNNSNIRWKPAIEFNPITDRKIDVRATGELLAIRFEFTNFSELQFFGFTAEYTLNGAR